MVAAHVFRYFEERKAFSHGNTPEKHQNLNANHLQNIFASILAASWRQASMCAGGFTRRWSRSKPVLCIVYDVSSCAYYEPWSRSRLVFQTNCIPHVHSDRILSCLIRGRMSKIQVASYLWSPLCTRVSQKKQKSEFWYATRLPKILNICVFFCKN